MVFEEKQLRTDLCFRCDNVMLEWMCLMECFLISRQDCFALTGSLETYKIITLEGQYFRLASFVVWILRRAHCPHVYRAIRRVYLRLHGFESLENGRFVVGSFSWYTCSVHHFCFLQLAALFSCQGSLEKVHLSNAGLLKTELEMSLKFIKRR